MKIRELLKDEKSWTKGEMSIETEGGTCFCLLGAVIHCYPEQTGDGVSNLLRKVIGESIICWNDAPERTHAEVLALVERLDV